VNKIFLNTIKKIYERGENAIQYFKDDKNLRNNTDEIIMVSYDFQSGNYIKM